MPRQTDIYFIRPQDGMLTLDTILDEAIQLAVPTANPLVLRINSAVGVCSMSQAGRLDLITGMFGRSFARGLVPSIS